MPPVSYGLIENTSQAITRLIKRLSKGHSVRFCYEAGACGYEVHRQITTLGYQCDVVAPSLIPRKAGERIKTDRRDALSLARLYRAGELTAVWVPDQEQEAMRDLVRAREDMKGIELRARQRLGAFLLRHGLIYPGKSTWTQAHFRWLEEVRLEHPVQQIVFQEYVDAVKQAQERARGVEEQMRLVLPSWNLAPAVEAISALRGVNMLTAVTVLAELGDISRFDSPRQLMAYLGLVPREHSSGASQWRGDITKTGNGHARRVLVEAAWTYRFPAR
jgi:transposase